MTIGTLKSPNPRNRISISVIKSKFLSVSSMNTLLAILKVTDARRDVILAGGLYHRFPWRHLLPPPPPLGYSKKNQTEVQPITLLHTFFHRKGNTFVYIILTNGTPSSYLELCISFNCCKCTQSLLNMKKSQNHNAFSTFSQSSNALLAILRDLFIDHNNLPTLAFTYLNQ